MNATNPPARPGLAMGLAVLFLAGALWVTACHVRSAFPWEDAFITYIYGRNLAEGHGLRYNPTDSEPTEGYSSPLHVLLCAAAHSLGLHPLSATRLISLLTLFSIPLAFGAVCARVVTSRGLAPAGALPSAVIAATCVVLYPFEDVVTHLCSGMDTVLFMVLHAHVFIAALALSLGPAPAPALRVAVFVALAALLVISRPEGPLLALGYVVAIPFARLAATPRAERRAGIGDGVAPATSLVVATLCAYVGLRYVYFGYLLPNPYYVKTHHAIFGSRGVLLPGLADVGSFLSARFVPVLVTVGCAASHFGFLRLLAAFGCMMLPSVVTLAVCGRTIHENASSFRYEIPLLFPLASFLAVVATIVWSRSPRTMALSLILLWAWCPVGIQRAWLAAPLTSFTAGLRYDESAVKLSALSQTGIDLGRTGLGQKATIWLSAAGMVPYYSRFRAIDWVGLNNNRLSGRTPLTLDEVWSYASEQKPDVVYSLFPPATPGCTERGEDPAFTGAEVVQEEVTGRSRATVLSHFWDPEKVAQMTWREMCFVRDHYRFGACWRYRESDVLIAYVRKDSPHASLLLDTLHRSTTADRFTNLEERYVNDPRLHGTTREEQAHWRLELEKASLAAALRKSPRDPRVHIAIGLVLEKEAQFEEAEQYYHLAIQSSPRHVLARFRLASLMARTGRNGEAFDQLREAHAIEPANADVKRRLDELSRTLTPPVGEEAALAEAARRDPKSAAAWGKLGACQVANGRLAEAEESLARALALEPRAVQILNELGLLYRARGDDAKALQYFEAAAARPDASPPVWYNVGMQLAQAGDAPRACRALRNFLAGWRGDPHHAEIARGEIARLEGRGAAGAGAAR